MRSELLLLLDPRSPLSKPSVSGRLGCCRVEITIGVLEPSRCSGPRVSVLGQSQASMMGWRWR